MADEWRTVSPTYFWGNILSSVMQRLPTKALWASLNAAAKAQQLNIGPGAFREVTRMRRTANGMRRAMENFSRMRPGTAIDAAVIAQDIDTRTAGVNTRGAAHRVRWEQIVTENGEQKTYWRTSLFLQGLPATNDELIDELNLDGEDLTGEEGPYSGLEHQGVGRLIITEV